MAIEKTVTSEYQMRCPKCGSDECIDIEMTVWARLTQDGTDPDQAVDESHYWNSESSAVCRKCDYSATVLDFEEVVTDEERSNGPKKR